MLRAALVVVVMFVGASSSAIGQAGSIAVRVVDQQGNPVPEAIVKMDPPPGRTLLYASPVCKTDESGLCTKNNLPMDTYIVRAKKPSDGYPDMSIKFYHHQDKDARVELTSENPNGEVVITLGQKAARLTLNIVADATGVPVKNAAIILRNASDASEWMGISKTSDSSLLLPPDEDVQIEISADGYKPWKLSEHPEAAQRNAIHLHSGETTELTIHLQTQ